MCTENTEPSWRGAKSDSKQPLNELTRVNKMYMYIQEYELSMVKWHVPNSAEQSVIVRNSLVVLLEQSRYPVRSSLESRVSVVQVMMYLLHVVEYRACFS